MIVKNYIVNKGYLNNFKGGIKYLNDNHIYYWFDHTPKREIYILEHLNFNECKKHLKETGKVHYYVVQVAFTGKSTKIKRQWLYQG